ncbi:MAG: thioredoxin [Oscillospiraceae bacterium]|nr:thioredoxin [Oscillospiraceae bacterium]
MSLLHINDNNYAQLVENSNQPILLDFWADWCMPCKMLLPILEELSQEEGMITIGKVNVDESPKLAEAYNVQTIPLLALVKDGTVLDSSVGVKSPAAIKAMIDAAL